MNKPGNEALQPVGERMIIRTADVSLEVKDTQAAADQIKAIAESLNGYVSSSDLRRTDDLLQGTVTVRVPATQFDAAMARIKAVGVKVEGEKLSSQDMTEEYTDLTARRRNLEATEQELLKLLTLLQELPDRDRQQHAGQRRHGRQQANQKAGGAQADQEHREKRADARRQADADAVDEHVTPVALLHTPRVAQPGKLSLQKRLPGGQRILW